MPTTIALRLHFTGVSDHVAEEFQLSDPADKASYLAINEHRDTVINPCLNSTYRFIERILKHLVDLHKVVCNHFR